MQNSGDCCATWRRTTRQLNSTRRHLCYDNVPGERPFSTCGNVARRALPKFIRGGPGDRRKCAKVAEKMLQSCRNVATRAEVRPKLDKIWPKLANIFQTDFEVGQSWRKFDPIQPILVDMFRKLTHIGRDLPNLGRFGQFGPMLGKCRVTLAELPRCWQVSAEVVRLWDLPGQHFDNFSTTLAQLADLG